MLFRSSGIDLSSLLEMNIPDTSYLESQLDSVEDGQERQKIKDEITQIREKFSKDINVVIDTLQKLDEKLKAKPDYVCKITRRSQNLFQFRLTSISKDI